MLINWRNIHFIWTFKSEFHALCTFSYHLQKYVINNAFLWIFNPWIINSPSNSRQRSLVFPDALLGLIWLFASIMRSRRRTSILKLFAFTSFGCFRQDIPLLLCGYLGRRYRCASVLIVCVSSYWFSCTPNSWCYKSCPLTVSFWLYF